MGLGLKVRNRKMISHSAMSGYVLMAALFMSTIPLAESSPVEELSIIQARAFEGDAHYQGILAMLYKYGESNLPVDIEESRRWAKLSAEKDGGIGLATLAAIELEEGKVQRGQFLYDEAYLHSNLRALAKSKDPIALFCVGLMEIDNPPRNIEKGMRNIERAANMGLATAQATLGMIYFTGIGVPRDPETAIKWCSQAVHQRLPLAMFYLGMAYSVGDGIKRNDDYSNRWIRAAADRGLVMAQLTLGMKLCHGDGIERNLTHGVTWLRQAANNGSAEAALQLRKFENLLVRSPPRQNSISDSEKQPLANLVKKSDSGESIAVKNVQTGQYIPSKIASISQQEEPQDAVDMAMEQLILFGNQEEAVSLLNEMAQGGKVKALRELGLLHYQEKEYVDARKNFLKASLGKDPESIRYLGIMHFLGQGVELDYAKAVEWLTQAQNLGDLESGRYLRIAKGFVK